MPEPEIALVFSPEAWVEGLHRHLADHGGARVRQVVMDPGLALEEEYGTLVVSHRWPALTRAFVDAVHRRRRRVLGVYDPGEPAGHEYLLGLGVDRTIEANASMSSFLDALAALTPDDLSVQDRPVEAVPAGVRLEHAGSMTARGRPAAVTVVGGTPGAGSTEVAIALAVAVAERGERLVLVDADEVVPSIAQRLSLPFDPNLRTAVDGVEYGMGSLDEALLHLRDARFDVVGGLPNVSAWSQVRPSDVLDVIERLASSHDHVVANIGSRLEDVGDGRGRYATSRALVGEASTILGVGAATPVGVTRLLGWVAQVRPLSAVAPLHLAINRAPSDPYRRFEIELELSRTFRPMSLSFVPSDHRVESAAWAGDLVARGPFTRAVDEITRTVLPRLPRVLPARSTGRARWRALRLTRSRPAPT